MFNVYRNCTPYQVIKDMLLILNDGFTFETKIFTYSTSYILGLETDEINPIDHI